jgi:hypothetical protein
MTDRRLYRLVDEVVWALTVSDGPLRWGFDPVPGERGAVGEATERRAARGESPDAWLAGLAAVAPAYRTAA